MSLTPSEVAALQASLNARCDEQLTVQVVAGVLPGAQAIARAMSPQLPPTSFARMQLRQDFATLVEPQGPDVDAIVTTALYRGLVWQLIATCDSANVGLAKGLCLTELQFAWDTYDDRHPFKFTAAVSYVDGVYTAKCLERLDASGTGGSFDAARAALVATLQSALGTISVEVFAQPDSTSAHPRDGRFII